MGIDPGFAKVGLSVLDSETLEVLATLSLETGKSGDFATRLLEIYDGIEGFINQLKPEHACIEKLFFFRNVTNALAVAEARGVITLVLKKKNIGFSEYTPLQIKTKVVGYGRADKKDIIKKVREILGIDLKSKYDDIADSLALSLCFLFDTNKSNLVEKATKPSISAVRSKAKEAVKKKTSLSVEELIV